MVFFFNVIMVMKEGLFFVFLMVVVMYFMERFEMGRIEKVVLFLFLFFIIFIDMLILDKI